MKLDSLDLEIIKVLQEDGRKSFREIAALLNKPESTIRLRYNQLVENQSLRIVAIPDPKSVGVGIMAIIGVKMDLKHLNEAAEIMAKFSQVRFIACTSGKYDLILQVFMSSNDELIDFMSRELTNITGVKDYELSIQLKVFKDTYEWIDQN